MNLKEILERIQAKGVELNSLVTKSIFTPADLDAATALQNEIKALQGQYELAQKADELKAWGNQPANRVPLPGSGGYTKAGHMVIEQDAKAWKMLENVGEGTFGIKTWHAIQEDSYLKAFDIYLRSGVNTPAGALKDLQEGIDAQGGYWAPPQMISRIISRMATPTRLGGKVTTITTSANSIVMPKVNYADSNEIYSTGFRVTYVGEAGLTSGKATNVSDTNLFGQSKIDIFTANMKTQIPRDFLADAGVDIQGFIAGKLAETVDLEVDNTIVNGTGVGRPLGIIPAIGTFGTGDSVRVVKSGSNTVFTANNIIALAYALPEQYISENCAFAMNRTNTELAVRELVDGQGRFIFKDGYTGLDTTRRIATLVGYDVLNSAFLPNGANLGGGAVTNNYPMIFGDWTGYYHAVRLGLSIQVLQELYTEQDQVGLMARFRHGGRPVEPWKLAALKIST